MVRNEPASPPATRLAELIEPLERNRGRRDAVVAESRGLALGR
jgi:hypothetical protein